MLSRFAVSSVGSSTRESEKVKKGNVGEKADITRGNLETYSSSGKQLRRAVFFPRD